MNIKTIINQKGEIVEMCVIQNEDGTFKDYSLKDGERAVAYLNSVQDTTNRVSHPPLKPLWNFTKNEWQETATEIELQEAYPPLPIPQPSIEQRTFALEAATLALMGGM